MADSGSQNPGSPDSAGKRLIGRFEILGEIGRGAMGAVFKARQVSVDRIVALKILPQRLAGDKKYVARFLREAQSVAKLNHPNIVQAFDAGEADGYYYFAMEFVDGHNADQFLTAVGRLPEHRALEIGRDIARALDYADTHAHLVHRDVKPGNILLTLDGTAKLADLGLAREATGTDGRLTQSGTAVGTPNYISPEQVRGEVGLDIRTDIYSLGATLYHLLTGSPPYTGGTGTEVMSKHLRDPVPNPRKANPELSPGVATIIRKTMAKKREQRYPNAKALCHDIEQALTPGESAPTALAPDPAATPVEAGAASTTTRLSRSPSEKQRWCRTALMTGIISLAVILLVVMGLVLLPKSGEQGRPDEAATRQAAAAFARLERLLDERQFSEALTLLATIEKEFSKNSWFTSHKDDLDRVRDQATAGIATEGAEGLYAQAAELFRKEQFFELKPLVEKLRTDYRGARLLSDPSRKPSFIEMARAVAQLGQFLTVRQDGKADFKTINAALDAAPQNTVIEIQDDGHYREQLLIHKVGVTLRGKEGHWPVILPIARPRRDRHFNVMLVNGVSRLTIERLVLVFPQRPGQWCTCFMANGGPFRFRRVIFYAGSQPGKTGAAIQTQTNVAGEVEECLVFGGASFRGTTIFKNCVWVQGLAEIRVNGPCEIRSCTIPGKVDFHEEPRGVVVDSIVGAVTSHVEGTRIEHCDVFAPRPFTHLAKPGKGCITTPPHFRGPKNLDYRLQAYSPCRGKASDGRDLGCRYTPAMLEMVKKALELRKEGIIHF